MSAVGPNPAERADLPMWARWLSHAYAGSRVFVLVDTASGARGACRAWRALRGPARLYGRAFGTECVQRDALLIIDALVSSDDLYLGRRHRVRWREAGPDEHHPT